MDDTYSPITTAPKDGQTIKLICKRGPSPLTASWYQGESWGWWITEGGIAVDDLDILGWQASAAAVMDAPTVTLTPTDVIVNYLAADLVAPFTQERIRAVVEKAFRAGVQSTQPPDYDADVQSVLSANPASEK